MDPRVGSHPDQIRRLAKKYGLECREYEKMNFAKLRAELRQRHPVLLMIQAWGRQKRRGRMRPRLDYRNDWKDGHWVVAIGYDSEAIFIEDPSLQAVRGYLRDHELDLRWRDTGRHGKHKDHYGIAIWHPHTQDSAYTTRAQRIE
jgi:predicted double-glycine peptidase